MIGNNKLHLNQAEMNKAVEYYLNTVVLKEPCSVTGVTYTQNDGYVFIVLLAPQKEITTGELLERAIANGTAIEKGNK